MKLFLHWLISAVAIIIAAYLVPGVHVTLGGAFVAAVILGIINLFIRPLLFVLTLPITILTLGLFSLVLNALLVWLAGSIIQGFVIDTFWSAFFFSIVLTLINWIFNAWTKTTPPSHRFNS